MNNHHKIICLACLPDLSFLGPSFVYSNWSLLYALFFGVKRVLYYALNNIPSS